MSRRADRAPFALTSEGTILVNVVGFDGISDVESLLSVAREQPGAVFIGVALTALEADFVGSELDHACRDAAARLAGRRSKRRVPRRSSVSSSRRGRSSP